MQPLPGSPLSLLVAFLGNQFLTAVAGGEPWPDLPTCVDMGTNLFWKCHSTSLPTYGDISPFIEHLLYANSIWSPGHEYMRHSLCPSRTHKLVEGLPLEGWT